MPDSNDQNVEGREEEEGGVTVCTPTDEDPTAFSFCSLPQLQYGITNLALIVLDLENATV